MLLGYQFITYKELKNNLLVRSEKLRKKEVNLSSYIFSLCSLKSKHKKIRLVITGRIFYYTGWIAVNFK
jgi:hypothetical protein